MKNINITLLLTIFALIYNVSSEYLYCDGENCQCWNNTNSPIQILNPEKAEVFEIFNSGKFIPISAYNESHDLHDLCYSNCGNKRSECDNLFCEDLRNICLEFYSTSDDLDNCLSEAQDICQIVNANGQRYFNIRQLENCACHPQERESKQEGQANKGNSQCSLGSCAGLTASSEAGAS